MALAALLLIMFVVLSIRQLISRPRRDKSSNLPVPPRALTGNGALPVFGHTRLFRKHAGDVILLFDSSWREWRCFPARFSRKLNDCFSIFIFGQWRVVVRGSVRVRKVLTSSDVRQGWAWSAPTALLGKSCLPLLQGEVLDLLKSLLREPLSRNRVSRFAPEFALLAEKFVDDLLAGKYEIEEDEEKRGEKDSNVVERGAVSEGDLTPDVEKGVTENEEEKLRKISFHALRSFTFDLIDGPILQLNLLKAEENDTAERGDSGTVTQQNTQDTTTRSKNDENEKSGNKEKSADDVEPPPSRDMMLLWMERIKIGLICLKVTVGREWMQMWRINGYGRAVNARMNLVERILTRHVSEQVKLVPVNHIKGVAIVEALTASFPLWTMAHNAKMGKSFAITGVAKSNVPRRQRANSVPALSPNFLNTNAETEEDISPPRARAHSVAVGLSNKLSGVAEVSTSKRKKKGPVLSFLGHLLRQVDSNGNGMTQVVITEICFLLWMAMDVVNAWTAMALHFLALDPAACLAVQKELNMLSRQYGKDHLFTAPVLSKMFSLDAVLYEAIRLCPPFLGGMMTTGKMVELEDAGVQIPAETPVILSQPTEEGFNMTNARGKRPEDLWADYPSLEIFGFLPLSGMELPIMILQSKVFLAVLMQRCEPMLTDKDTFLERLKNVVNLALANVANIPAAIPSSLASLHTGVASASSSKPLSQTSRSGKTENAQKMDFSMSSTDDLGRSRSSVETVEENADEFASETETVRDEHVVINQTDCMNWFTKLPFPEPRRVLTFKARRKMKLISETKCVSSYKADLCL